MLSQAQESLALVRAALEIAGGRPEVPVGLRWQMLGDATCLRALAAGKPPIDDCRAPYTDKPKVL